MERRRHTGINVITAGDAVSVTPKYLNAYLPDILTVKHNPMHFTDRSESVSRRREKLHFPEIISADERDPQLKKKISGELALVVRHLMQRFSQPQQNYAEAMRIKCEAEPVLDFCGYLFTTLEPNALYMGNAIIRRSSPGVTFSTPIWPIWPIWRLTAIRFRSA